MLHSPACGSQLRSSESTGMAMMILLISGRDPWTHAAIDRLAVRFHPHSIHSPSHGHNEPVRRLIILGSTGSVGTQALDIIRINPDLFAVVGLAAGGGNPELIARQQSEFPAAAVAVGAAAATRLVEDTDADLVLNAITGSV